MSSSVPSETVTRFVVAFALLGASATSAFATDRGPYTVRAGIQTEVLTYAAYNPLTCGHVALPIVTIQVAPAHGTATIGKSSQVVEKGRCTGKTVKSATVHYRADPGYHGTDTISVAVETEIYVNRTAMRSDRVDISLIVK